MELIKIFTITIEITSGLYRFVCTLKIMQHPKDCIDTFKFTKAVKWIRVSSSWFYRTCKGLISRKNRINPSKQFQNSLNCGKDFRHRFLRPLICYIFCRNFGKNYLYCVSLYFIQNAVVFFLFFVCLFSI